jgi:hypothetical protein
MYIRDYTGPAMRYESGPSPGQFQPLHSWYHCETPVDVKVSLAMACQSTVHLGPCTSIEGGGNKSQGPSSSSPFIPAAPTWSIGHP